MPETETKQFAGPPIYVYRGHQIVMTHELLERNPYSAVIVPIGGGKVESISFFFTEASARREAQHVVDLKLSPRPVSQAEQDFGEELDAMSETDR